MTWLRQRDAADFRQGGQEAPGHVRRIPEAPTTTTTCTAATSEHLVLPTVHPGLHEADDFYTTAAPRLCRASQGMVYGSQEVRQYRARMDANIA
ncbi:hypothetical protein VTI74DRAFT_10347 [Chaetomium olivicolor]